MKRIGNIWPEIHSWDNLMLAWKKAAKGKRQRQDVALFGLNLERELCRLQSELMAEIWQPGAYTQFQIYESKARLISAAPFRDRVVHHALLNVLEPRIDPQFIYDSYACRQGKGVHAAVDRYQIYANQFDYVMLLDISKYFASVDRSILKCQLENRIKDGPTMAVLRKIIDGGPVVAPTGIVFPGEDLIDLSQRCCGIPIGNLTSQFFANVYLDGFDHWLKHSQKIKGYIRYVDDFFIFSSNRSALIRLKQDIDLYLAKLHVRLHPNKVQLCSTRQRVDVLGYVVSRNRRWLRNQNGYRAQRRMRYIVGQFQRGEIDWPEVHARFRSWIGHAQHGETQGLRQAILYEFDFYRAHKQDEPALVARRLVEQQTEEVAFC